jgi:hypothetical protein
MIEYVIAIGATIIIGALGIKFTFLKTKFTEVSILISEINSLVIFMQEAIADNKIEPEEVSRTLDLIKGIVEKFEIIIGRKLV